jgi:hypothetical protein
VFRLHITTTAELNPSEEGFSSMEDAARLIANIRRDGFYTCFNYDKYVRHSIPRNHSVHRGEGETTMTIRAIAIACLISLLMWVAIFRGVTWISHLSR